MSNPEPTQPEAPPEQRILRGCTVIIFLLLLGVIFNFLEYRFNVVTIVASILFAIAVVARIVIVREAKGKKGT